MLPALTTVQVDFSAGQITEKAARRDDIKLQRSGLKRSINTRALSTGALAQRMGRSAVNLDTGRSERIRLSEDLQYDFLFGDGALRIRDLDGNLLNEFPDMPWSIDTIADIGLAVAEGDVFLGYPGARPKHLRLGSFGELDVSGGAAFSDMLDARAYPVVEGSNSSKENSNVSSHTVSLPSGIVAGELLLVFFRHGGTSTPSHAPPSGWGTLAQKAGTSRSSIFWRVATGSEGSTITVTTSSSIRTVHGSVRISGYAGDPEADFASTLVTNPPSLTPSWGSAKVLWLALVTMNRSNQTITSVPSSYTSVINVANTSSGLDTYARLGLAKRTTTASSENPGDFTISGTAENPHAATIAIKAIGDAAEAGKAFDDVTNKAASQCLQKSSATAAFVGLDFSSNPQAVTGVTVYGSNDQGYVNGSTPNVTITLYGKNGSIPTLASRGTSLGTATAADTANESGGRAITSSDTTTLYDYLAIVVEHDGAAATMYVAQVEFSTPVASVDDSNWLIGPYLFDETPEGALRQPYVRYAAKGIEMLCSARTGTSIDVTFSSAVLASGHVGVSFRFHERELVITSVTSATAGKANVIETLPPTRRVTCDTANGRNSFKIGQVVIGETSGAEGLVVAFNSTDNLDVIVYKGDNFVDTERIISPTGQSTVSGDPSEITLAASTVWDEAAFSDYRGWPAGLEYDRSRLVLFRVPQAPRAIAWSAIGAPNDLLIGADATDAFLEFAPGKGNVLHVIGGNDQFVLTDLGAMYIPISESNPLAPGRVAFRPIAAIGAGTVKPVAMHEGIVYSTENRKSLIAIVPTGQTAFPYRTAAISEFHADLFTGVRCLAAMAGGGQESEQYLWACQDDGTAVVGKFDSSNEWAGFVPVTGEGVIRWISALGGEVTFNTEYSDAFDWVIEMLDEASFLDGAVPLNQTAPGLRPDPDDPSLGRLWFYASMTVDLMDGEEHLGARAVDSDGFIVEQDGDDFSGDDVMAGFGFDVMVVPYLANQGEGEERGQRVRRRRVKRAAVHVQDSTRFRFMGRVFGGTAAATGVYRAPGNKRTFEPEVLLEKTVPGPLRITEIDAEVTT